MLALKSRSGPLDFPEQDPAAAGDKMVLPRPLRRAVRFLGSLASGRVNIPRHVGSVSVVAFYAATALYIFALVGEWHVRHESMPRICTGSGFSASAGDLSALPVFGWQAAHVAPR